MHEAALAPEQATPGFDNVAATAFVVAKFRAEVNAQAEPLYRDPIVDELLTQPCK